MTDSKYRVVGTILRTLVVVVASVGVTVLVASRVVSDDEKPGHAGHDHAKKVAGGHDKEMEAKWMAMMSTGPHHKHLEAMVGEWNAENSHWMTPGGEPQVSKATSKNTLIFGGRYLQQEYNGMAMGQPFQGRSIMGYDNAEKKYVSTWIDSMGTGIFYETGACDQSGKVFTLEGDHFDPMTGKKVKLKTVTRIIDKDKHVFEMHKEGPDGKVFKEMVIVYTRK